jgi:2-polyprenyl-3-methyl-5-hydroxy-6-metoxy-1,4-benzoquinol methylase
MGNVATVLRWLRSRLERQPKSDVLSQSAQAWEAQYADGRWDYLARLSELGRYSVLAGYVCHLRPGGSVLDAGCGQGVLLRRLPDHAYSRYVGIDVSESAIAAARKLEIDRSSFAVIDCEGYAPDEQFDVLVFNEVLYCLRDPLAVVQRYTRSLRADGVVLVSMCTAARGASTIFEQLNAEYSPVDETRVTHGQTRLSWDCAAFRPK